jgi:hypothetical protein
MNEADLKLPARLSLFSEPLYHEMQEPRRVVGQPVLKQGAVSRVKSPERSAHLKTLEVQVQNLRLPDVDVGHAGAQARLAMAGLQDWLHPASSFQR